MKTLLEYIKRGTKQVEKGIKKYGGTLDDSDLSVIELAENSLEEKIDDVFYTIKLLEKIKEQERELLSLREKLEGVHIENKEKTCQNCESNNASAYSEPCKSCIKERDNVGISYSKWQPRKEGSE